MRQKWAPMKLPHDQPMSFNRTPPRIKNEKTKGFLWYVLGQLNSFKLNVTAALLVFHKESFTPPSSF